MLRSPKITEPVKIDVSTTEKLTQLTYQVIGKGDVIVSETIPVDNQKNVQFEFTPTLAMVPTANVIVFYMTDDGEIISDSMKVEFGNELRNHVSCKI